MKRINLIAAVGTNGALSYQGKIPWVDKADQQFFRFVTRNSLVVVGHNTWNDVAHLQNTYGREFLCATRHSKGPTPWQHGSWWLQNYAGDREVWIAGGAKLYESLAVYVDGKILINYIRYDGPFDTAFPYHAFDTRVTTIRQI